MVHMIQIAPPSRDTIKEYQAISDALDPRWAGSWDVCRTRLAALTYVKRAYAQASWPDCIGWPGSGWSRPLRDGMNLVAHEYVGAQDPEDPGVLVLSRFAGAAEIFHDALLVNPFDTDETAEAMRMALVMPLDERKARWNNLMAAARNHSVDRWAEISRHFGGLDVPDGDADRRRVAKAVPEPAQPITRKMPKWRSPSRVPQTPGMPFVPWVKSLFSGT